MTVAALLRLTGKELEEYYHKSGKELAEAEAKAREANKFNEAEWQAVWLTHETQFREAVDIKFKLRIIKYMDFMYPVIYE